MSKGSRPRPFDVANEEYAQRWDLIFGRDNEKTNKAPALEADRPSETRNIGGGNNRVPSAGQTETEGTGSA